MIVYPSLVSGLDESIYRAEPAISQSTLRHFYLSPTPLHHFEQYVSPAKPPSIPTAAMELGSLFHRRFELGSKFSHFYIRAPDIRKGTNAYRDFCKTHANKQVVRASDWDLVDAMYSSLMSHSGARALLENGFHEESFFYKRRGYKVKGRFDFRNPELKVVIDLKMSVTGSPIPSSLGFPSCVFKSRMDMQDAFYLDAVEKLTGDAGYTFIFIVVERSFPHAVSLHHLQEEERVLATSQIMTCLDEYIDRLETGDWGTGYGINIHPLRVPKYLQSSIGAGR